MEKACEEALRGMEANDGGPFGAVIVRGDEIIAIAHNEVLKSNDPTAHAEINAIRMASAKLGRFDLSDCELYTTCYPCPMCLGAVFWARIPVLYYAATKEDAAKGGFDDARFHTFLKDPASAVSLRPLDPEAGQMLFTRWLEKKDRQLY